MHPRPPRTALCVGVLLLLVAAPVGATTGQPLSGLAGGSDGPSLEGEDLERLSTPIAQTNNTTQHKNPERTSEDGDLGQVASWLNGRLAGQFRGSTLELTQREYELARQFVGDDFGGYLGQYVDVAGDTAADADDEAAASYQDLQRAQQTLISRSQEYEQTYQAYQEARQAGNLTRAGRLARQLREQADGVNESAVRVTREARVIENRTGVSLDETITRLTEFRQTILAQEANVTASLFADTRLTATANRSRAAFDRPVAVTGRLVVTNASAAPPSRITLRLGETTQQVTLDDQGRFTFQYRPTLVPATDGNVTLEYLPEPRAPYLGTETDLPIAIDQVQSSLQVTTNRERVRFGDTLRVNGTLTAAGRAVPGVPLTIRVGKQRLGRVQTDADGTYSLATAFPAAVAAGDRRVRVRFPETGRAIAVATASAPVVVDTTDTALSVDVVRAGETVRVRGQLRTVNGQPVPGQPIRIAGQGTTYATTQTGANGTYVAQFERPTDEALTARARFQAEGTNLNPASAEFILPPADSTAAGGDGSQAGGNGSQTGGDGSQVVGDGSEGGDAGPQAGGDGGQPLADLFSGASSLPVLLIMGVLGAVVLGAGIFLWWWRRRPTDTADDGDQTATTASVVGPADDGSDSSTPVDRVEEAIADGEYDRAGRELYALVRASLAERVAGGDVATHWEFYETVAGEDSMDSDVPDVLRTVTETYERAAFAPATIDEGRAQEALTAGERLLQG